MIVVVKVYNLHVCKKLLGDTVADRGSMYSLDLSKLQGRCCSCCRRKSSTVKQSFDHSQSWLLVESCREKLDASNKPKLINYGDLECSLAT